MNKVIGTFIGVDVFGKEYQGDFEIPYHYPRPSYEKICNAIKMTYDLDKVIITASKFVTS